MLNKNTHDKMYKPEPPYSWFEINTYRSAIIHKHIYHSQQFLKLILFSM